jgi:cytochrome c oxidase cbb3-type subunit 3
MSSFWSWWIIVLTVISFVLIFWILLANRKGDAEGPDVGTTGHAADGIEEFDNPLPYWWFLMFLFTLVFGIAYLIAYPGMGNFPGLLGWTQLGQWEEQVEAADERFSAMRHKYLAMPIEDVAADPPAVKMGQRMFANECSQCHGSDAKGSYGFPNLSDGDWIWGGTPDAIKHSITHGRQAAMPPWGAMLGEDGVNNVTAYVRGLNGMNVDADAASAGQEKFAMLCTACHGAEATGNPMLGAANLTNGIWLYGGEADQIAHSVRAGRNGVMPSFKDTIGEDKIHLIAAYVYSLSN